MRRMALEAKESPVKEPAAMIEITKMAPIAQASSPLNGEWTSADESQLLLHLLPPARPLPQQDKEAAAIEFPHSLVSGVWKEARPRTGSMSLPLGGCIRESSTISIRCFSSEAKTDPGFSARWR